MVKTAQRLTRSNRALATALSVNEGAVRRWRRDERWPFGAPPWKPSLLPRIQAWARRTLAPNPAADVDATPKTNDLSPERKAKLRVTRERARKLQLEREIKQGEYHRADECQQRVTQLVTEARNRLMGMFRSLAGPLNLTEDQVRIGEGRMIEILQGLAQPRASK